MTHTRSENPPQPGEKRPEERPRRYERPRVLFREPLEMIASVCDPPGGKESAGACAIVGS
jgi:hypothetical protein